MSIINRMLKDLDSAAAPQPVNRFYASRRSRLPAWYWFVLVLLPVVLWLWWPYLHALRTHVPAVTSVVQQPVSAPTVTQTQASSTSTSMASAAVPAVGSQPVVINQPANTVIPDPAQTQTTGTTPVAVPYRVPATPASPVSTAHSALTPVTTSATGTAPSSTVPDATEQPSSSQEQASMPETASASADNGTDPEDGGSVVTVETKPELHIEEEHLDATQLATIARRNYQAAMAKEDRDGAKDALRDVLAQDPLDVSSRKKLAGMYYGENQLQPALQILDQGVQLTPMNPDLRLYAARIALAMNNKMQALRYLTDISPSVAPNIDFYAMRAALSQQTGQTLEATTTYRALMQAQPYVGRWALGLGITKEMDHQSRLAADAYRRALLDSQLPLAARQFAQQRLQLLESNSR